MSDIAEKSLHDQATFSYINTPANLCDANPHLYASANFCLKAMMTGAVIANGTVN